MSDFTLNEMQEMQKTLQDHYKTIWEPIGPENGKTSSFGCLVKWARSLIS